MRKQISVVLIFFCTLSLNAQYWQQKVNYVMDIDFRVEDHQYTGKQTLSYFNNSPDTLHRVFFHLYNNAFQPGSLMALKGDRKSDPSKGVKSIQEYDQDEIGFLHINVLKQNGVELEFDEQGTIMIVELASALAPNKKTKLYIEFR